ncbi:MAG TPA: WYL domain-containing protein [Fibrobacteraceae bacterium]|nr:WYL domain-containing protein [Fibrobacteraceae bacterium]
MGSQYENAQELIRYLEGRRSYTSYQELTTHFDWSRATFFRALRKAKETCTFDIRKGIGYRLDISSDAPRQLNLLPQETEALATIAQLLYEEEVLQDTYAGMRNQFLERLRQLGIPLENWEGRIHNRPQHRRNAPPVVFRRISHALLRRKVISFDYENLDGKTAKREVHPQQLILYRNGWSLDALEESSIGKNGAEDQGLRQFSLDQIRNIRMVKKAWTEVSLEALHTEFAGGYGLFSGKPDAEAVIRFTGVAAFYARRETWHPDQKCEECPDGSVILRIPFVSRHPEELIGDILRWGECADVQAPEFLRKQVREKILRMAGKVS